MTIVLDDLQPVQVNIIPVPHNLAHGAETAQWIYDQIVTYPESWYQRKWEETDSCGTTRCVAGWAAFLNQDMWAGIFASQDMRIRSADSIAYIRTGIQALGISELEARWLFYDKRTEEEVLQGLKEIVSGLPVSGPDETEPWNLMTTLSMLEQ